MQVFAVVVSLAIAVVGIALFVQAIRSMVATIRIGQPAAGSTDQPAAKATAQAMNGTLGAALPANGSWMSLRETARKAGDCR